MARYALFGGTFDPFHRGHLALAKAALAAVDAVLVIPVGESPPHRGGPVAGAEDRYAMAALGIANQPGLGAVRWETDRAGRTYAIDTVAIARAELGAGADLHWVIGADAMADVAGWHRASELFAAVAFLVAPRDGHGEAWLRERVPVAARWAFLPMPEVRASSTAVRHDLLRTGASPLIDPAVAEYIARHGLYAGETV